TSARGPGARCSLPARVAPIAAALVLIKNVRRETWGMVARRRISKTGLQPACQPDGVRCMAPEDIAVSRAEHVYKIHSQHPADLRLLLRPRFVRDERAGLENRREHILPTDVPRALLLRRAV